MKFLFTDETNITQNTQLEFFIYGGIILDSNQIRFFSEELNKIKINNSINTNRPIQWTNKNFEDEGCLDNDLHKKIKHEILEFIRTSDCKIIIYLSLQDFYHHLIIFNKRIKSSIDPESQKKSYEYAINVILSKFNSYLIETSDTGIVISDSFEGDIKKHLKNHCNCLYYNGGDYSNLKQIIHPIIPVNEEYSPIHQINDVVLGSIQHSLKELRYNFFPVFKDKFWQSDSGQIFGRGINIYPKNPKVPDIIRSVTSLREKFIRLMNY